MNLQQRLKLAQLPKKEQLLLLMRLSKLKTVLDKEGLISFQKGEKHGFIDKEGNEIIPCIYDSVEEFSDGLAKIKLDGKLGYINKEGVQYWED